MANNKSAAKPAASAAVAAAPTVASTPSAPVTKAPAAKRRRAEDKVTSASVEVIVTPAVTIDAAASATAAPVAGSWEAVISELEGIKANVGKALSAAKDAAKVSARKLKEAQAPKKRKAAKDPNAPPRKPSGITRPQAVSEELTKFLGKPAGTELSRTQTAGLLLAYIREKKLFDTEVKKRINPDAGLKALLRLKDGDVLTIPSLQKFIGVHFPKKA